MKRLAVSIFVLVFICIFEQIGFTKPNIVGGSVSSSAWTGLAGRGEMPYETIESFSEKTLCMIIKSREKKTYNFYIEGSWVRSDNMQSLLDIKSEPVRLKPKQQGKLCIGVPDNLSGDINFEGMINYE